MAIALMVSGWASLVYSRHFNLLLPHFLSVKILGIFFFLMGITIRLLAFKEMNNPYKIDRLVTSGVYSKTRNPVYLAYICIIIAVAFLTMRLLSFAWVFGSILVFYWVAKKEEDDLEKIFGEEYVIYKQTVPLFLPKVS